MGDDILVQRSLNGDTESGAAGTQRMQCNSIKRNGVDAEETAQQCPLMNCLQRNASSKENHVSQTKSNCSSDTTGDTAARQNKPKEMAYRLTAIPWLRSSSHTAHNAWLMAPTHTHCAESRQHRAHPPRLALPLPLQPCREQPYTGCSCTYAHTPFDLYQH